MKVYFPGLNSLRFIAAFGILIFHIEGFKYTVGLGNLMNTALLRNLGPQSVSFFFVLSGFLITYLLLVEKGEYGKIDIKQFYIRRALRIWPLYYLITLIGLYLIPLVPFFHFPGYPTDMRDIVHSAAPLFFFMLPNVAEVLYTIYFIGGLWSIGVEEQFYLFWPWLIRTHKRHFRWLFIIIISMFLIRFGIAIYLQHHDTVRILLLRDFFDLLKFDCMAIGAIAACLLYYRKLAVLKFIYRRDIQFIGILLLVLLLFINTDNWFRTQLWYYVLFAIIILNVATGTKPLFQLHQRWLDYLGRISYGIYLYQPIVIYTCLKLLQKFVQNSFALNVLLYLFSIAFTIIVSAISYETFELFFLRFKKYFTRVKNLEPA